MNRAPAWTALAGLAVFAGALEARSEDPAPTNAVDVVSDTTWSGEVRLARPIRVGMGATLRIAPGTRITIPWVEAGGRESAEKPGIEVAGRLVAGGDANAPIRFEPERMPSAVTRAGWKRWRGILVLDGAAASARLVHCLIVGADAGFQPGNSSCVAQDCTFFDCSTGIGIGVLWGNRTQVVRFAGDVAPTIEGCRFGKCVAGLSVELAARPTVRHCLFHGCEAGIANRRDGDTYPLKGLGPYVDRCEFLRCQIAIEGPSRVTNSVFESNQRVFVGSRFGEFDLTEIDEFIRGKNLYWANDQLVRSDVPLGVDALFADPKRRGVAPETMSADELLQPLDGVLGLRPDSPGKGTASDGGDLGAFGGEGTVRTQPPDASGGPGLAIEGWLHIGPAAPDAGALSGLARDVSSHPRLAGDVDGGAQWAALEGGLLADPDGSKKLVAELPEARTLLATLSSDREGNVSLRFAWDGTLVAWWNGESLPLPDGPRRFRPEDATATVARRKGPNTLLVRHGPRATTGRLAVRVVDALGGVAPEGLSPMPTSPPGKTTSSQPIASVSWSIERGPAGKATGRGFLKIALANLVHWRDASNLRRYGLVDPGGKPADLAGADVLFQPKDRSVVLTLPRLLAAGAWKIKVTDWHRAFGEPFPPDPAGVTFRVP